MRKFIIEADGGSRGNPGPAGCGAIVIDAHTGEIVAELGKFLGVATNNVAEYSAMIAGLEHAITLSEDAQLHVRMDSKLVIEQMSNRWKVKHPDMQLLATHAKSVIKNNTVTFEWIPREKNFRADALANEAMDTQSNVFR